jgi:hypothetical protein
VKGEVHGTRPPPSSEHENDTGRLAAKPMLGKRFLLIGFGGLTIVTAGGRAKSSSSRCASISPPPTALGPKEPTGLAVAAKPVAICAGLSVGFACRASAATAAAWGAAADVPQKR